jgi:hypothetical protein
MRASLRYFSKLPKDATAADEAAWQRSLALPPKHFASGQNREGALARLAGWVDEFVALMLGLGRLEEVNDGLGRTAETSRKPAAIICDAAHAPAPPRTGDLHDVTGHHRYYGRAAYYGS